MADGRLELRDVTLALAGRPVIANLSLTVAASDLVTVMGPSGSGKSSLLAFICGTLDPAFRASGSVRLGGAEITGLPPERRRVGILFQDDLLFPHLSVAENLAFGLPPSVAGRRARAARIEEALAEADLAGFGARDPATLSGGQRARVALLRTLLSEPRRCCSTSPSPSSTSRCATASAASSSITPGPRACRPCWSPTTRPTPRRPAGRWSS